MSLRVLDLECVFITEDMLHRLSRCSLLEKIKLLSCEGLKNVKVKNLLRLTDLSILSVKEQDDHWDISNVPRLFSFCYRTLSIFNKHIPFQIDSAVSVTQLCIEGVMIKDDLFFKTLEPKFFVLESLTLGINYWEHENMVINSVSLKWLTLNLAYNTLPTGSVVNVQVYAPRLLSFIYTGSIPGLLFRSTAPEQVKLTFNQGERLDHSYFLKMREALNLSSKFDINIRSANLESVAYLNCMDVDNIRGRDLFPVGNVQLTLETPTDVHRWEDSLFLDALFLICHPSYIRSSYEVIRKIMEENTTDLEEVLLKNPDNGNWEALTSSWMTVLHTFPGHLFECKLNWFPE